MAKRKTDCALNDIIGCYLKKTKCEKSLKLLKEKENNTKNDEIKMLEKFFQFLKEKETEKENAKNEDLGFEINFGAYQSDKKLPLPVTKRLYTHEDQKIESMIKERILKKKKAPKEFIKKIAKLGMRVEDADVLYETKIDWTAVYSDNKLYCTERACNFHTKIDNGVLTEHLINRHSYGEYPCNHADCKYVGYSKSNLNYHARMHSRKFEKEYWYKCPFPSCKSTFRFQFHVDIHKRIHENDSKVCSYCPFRYVEPSKYARHLRQHFGIKDFECDQCDASFFSQGDLNLHKHQHEGITFTCLICKNYETHTKNKVERHLRTKHADIVGKNFSWGMVEHHVKVIK